MSSHAGNICAQSKCLQSSCCLVFFSWLNLRQTLYFCFLLLPVEESSKSAEVDVWCHISSFFYLPSIKSHTLPKLHIQCFWSFSLTFSSSRIMMTMMMMMMAMMVMMMMVMTMMVIAGRQMSIAAWCCLSCPPPAGFYNGARGSALSALHSSLAMEGVLQYKAAMHWSHLHWIAKELPTVCVHCKRQPLSECTLYSCTLVQYENWKVWIEW